MTLPLLVRRDLALAMARPAEWLMPTGFFLLVAILLPFAVGPQPDLIARLAVAILWVGALLAGLLPVATLFAIDAADGTLDQLLVRPIAPETLAAARMASLAVAFGLPLLLAAPVAAVLLGMAPAHLGRALPALGAGVAGLAALGVVAAAVSLGARGGGALTALLVLPLALPLMLFGANPGAPGALGLLAASALLLVAVAPFAAGAALRLART